MCYNLSHNCLVNNSKELLKGFNNAATCLPITSCGDSYLELLIIEWQTDRHPGGWVHSLHLKDCSRFDGGVLMSS